MLLAGAGRMALIYLLKLRYGHVAKELTRQIKGDPMSEIHRSVSKVSILFIFSPFQKRTSPGGGGGGGGSII